MSICSNHQWMIWNVFKIKKDYRLTIINLKWMKWSIVIISISMFLLIFINININTNINISININIKSYERRICRKATYKKKERNKGREREKYKRKDWRKGEREKEREWCMRWTMNGIIIHSSWSYVGKWGMILCILFSDRKNVQMKHQKWCQSFASFSRSVCFYITCCNLFFVAFMTKNKATSNDTNIHCINWFFVCFACSEAAKQCLFDGYLDDKWIEGWFEDEMIENELKEKLY